MIGIRSDIKLSLNSQSKKIRKQRALKALKISKKFQSFYSGGKFMIIDKFFFSLCDDQIYVFDFHLKRVVAKINHEGEQIENFTYIKEDKVSYLYTFTKNGILRYF